MKRVILYSVLIFTLLYFPNTASCEETSANYFNREQAVVIASEIVEQKQTSVSDFQDMEKADLADFIDQGYEAWANSKFDEAKKFFQNALILAPYNMDLVNLIHDVERDKIKFEEQQSTLQKEIIEQKRMLETDKAWLKEQPKTKKKSAKTEKETVSTLKMQAAQKKVSIDFNDAQINKILEYLSKVSGINIIMDESAVSKAGRLTIVLEKVTLLQALESILRTKGLSYRFENDFIWVSSKENIANEAMITRIYHLSQGLAAFTSFTTFDTVTVEGLRGDNDVVLGDDISSGDGEASIPGVRTYEGVKIGGPSGIAGKVTLTIKDVLKQLIDWPEGSRIFLDNRTSTLIVRNTPTNVGILEEMLEAIDVNPPQVMIEARFVEIGKDDLFSLGLKLSPEISVDGAVSPTTYPFNKNQDTKYASAFPSPTSEELAFGTLDFSQFQAVLSAIEQNTDTNTLSSPKITTISGQEAVIKIVKEYRYPTKYEVEVVRVEDAEGNTVTQSFPVPVEFTTRDIGIILKVTPNVGSDEKTINLTLVPEVSEFDIEDDMYNFGTETRPFLQPFFNTRNATASIIVNNNDTVVMGGLMREVVEKGVDRVPILGHIPLIGQIFSRKVDNKQKRNLLIFVTAHIIAPTGERVENDSAL